MNATLPGQSDAGANAGSKSRTLSNAIIGLFLAVQVLVPLGYYLGDGGTDERFRWRMFSSVRLQRCRVSVRGYGTEGPQRLDPGQDIQVAWVNLLKRNRPRVVERYLERACQREGLARVRLRRRCRDTDGSELPALDIVRRCENGTVVSREVPP